MAPNRIVRPIRFQPSQRYVGAQRHDEDALTRAIIQLASQYGRYGYRRITVLLRDLGWEVGKDRVQRIWRREGLKVPQKQRPRGRLWLNDGSWPARSRSRHATLYTEGSDSFVASAASSIATGWSEPVPGRDLHPQKSSAFHGALSHQLSAADKA